MASRKRGRVSEHAFHRFIVSHPKWNIEFDGGERLLLHSGSRAGGETRAGFEIFGLEFDDLASIVIDPGTKHGFEIMRAEFPAYREVAEAIEVEAAWQRLARGVERSDDLGRVVHFQRYHVASVKKREGFLMIHVPHADGGMFVPIFTHRDALEIAMSDFRKNFSASEITTAEVPGERLFPPLAHENAEGIVINYLGPSPLVAFRRGVLDVIFAALANQGPAA